MRDTRDVQGALLSDKHRLTGIGNILRKTSLDELPQLWNVITGDMSLIGPRPLRVRYLPYYTEKEKMRHTVRPGITGLAQISGRNAIGWDQKLEKDIEYVEKLSFRLDLHIFLFTLKKLIYPDSIELPEVDDSFDDYRKKTMDLENSGTV